MRPDQSRLYKVRSDVHLTEICGIFLLIAEKKARGECAYVREINESAAFFWRLLSSEGVSLEKLLDEGKKQFEIEDVSAFTADVRSFLEMLETLHYLN